MTSTKQNIMGITTANGIHFIVRRIEAETMHHGKANSRALIAFYDARYPHTDFGQFIGEYYAHTLADVTSGLDLHGGVANWKIDADSMKKIQSTLIN
jgi:hypothetical protein